MFLGRYDEALRQFDLALALGGRTNDVFATLALVDRDGRVTPEALERLARPDPDRGAEEYILRWHVRILARDLPGARKESEPLPELLSSQWYDYPRALLFAITDELAGEGAKAHSEYEAARDMASARIQVHPEDARPHAPLALALAGLGQHDEALREARRATEMLPVERDTIVGGALLLDRFYTELRADALDDAVRSLEEYLSRPACFSLRALVLDPRLEALKGNARFEELCKRKAEQ